MIFGGIKKTSLIDYPDKISTLIYTIGCNFRCGFCHNPNLVLAERFRELERIDEKYVFELLEKRKNYIEALAITGGEPLMHKEIIDFIKRVKDMGFLVKLDTNGSYPKMVEKLIDYVDYFAMDVKAPLNRYKEITRVDIDINAIKRSIELIKDKAKDYCFRTTAIPDLNYNDFEEIGKLIKGAKMFYLQQFTNKYCLLEEYNNKKTYTQKQLEEIRDIVKKYIKKIEIVNI